MSTARIRLSRIIALNWYGYRDIIDVRGLSLLCGETGTGKSALLDLIQFVLCPRTYKFNKAAAGESNARDLRGYCLADTSTRDRQSEQTRYVRRGGVTVAALEFEWPATAASDAPQTGNVGYPRGVREHDGRSGLRAVLRAGPHGKGEFLRRGG